MLGSVTALATQLSTAQEWQPTRISPTSQAQPLSQYSARTSVSSDSQAASSNHSQARNQNAAASPQLSTTAHQPATRQSHIAAQQTNVAISGTGYSGTGHSGTEQVGTKQSGSENLGTGVVLRWRTTGASTSPSEASRSSRDAQPASIAAQSLDQPSNPLRQAYSTNYPPTVRPASDLQPIDGYRRIQSAQYEQDALGSAMTAQRSGYSPLSNGEAGAPNSTSPNQFNSILDSRTVTRGMQDELPPFPGATEPSRSNPLDDVLGRPQQPGLDPLDSVESAPEPPVQDDWSLDPPSFPPQLGEEESPADQPRSDREVPSPIAPDAMPDRGWDGARNGTNQNSDDELESILRRAREAATLDCATQREQLKGQPLSSISLDVSPKLGDGIRTIKKQTEDDPALLAEVRQRALRRDWTDYRGDHLASGRLLDLRYGNVILDIDGREHSFPLYNLSDVDMSYIAELWNLPTRCGSGYESLEGRQFVNSIVQWKASVACHNPLYFEQVQLERYGHETGPVLQPLISSAHFLLTIPMLPYKMAINPPNECQYALGYYRPGDCAPYMMQPFPWSVRAGLVQAGVMTGVSAIFP